MKLLMLANYREVGLKFVSCIVLWAVSFLAWPDNITVATYYGFEPWLDASGRKGGLTEELASELTKKSNGLHQFTSRYIPKKRIQIMLNEGKSIIVPWVRPQFFSDNDKTRYLWSKPIMKDIAYVDVIKTLRNSSKLF